MARLIARRDAAARYVYIRSGDSFAVPQDARDVIKRHGGEFSGDTKEWRVHIDQGADVVAIVRSFGHDVIAVEAGQERQAALAVECRACATPYPSSKASLPDEFCPGCAEPLELVHPHECDEKCAEMATSPGRSVA